MVVDVVLFVVGAALVVVIMLSAIRTVVLPTGHSVRLTRSIFGAARAVARAYGRVDRYPGRRHAAMQLSVVVGLVSLPIVWLGCAVVGFTLMFWGLGTESWRESYDLAGSSMFTLGFTKAGDLPRLTLSFVGAALAISILALLLVTYLPTIYAAYIARESRLTMFETFAGDPPDAVDTFIRLHRIGSLGMATEELWDGWREWFAELRETHTALPAVAFLGSSRSDRSWVATVGTLLDTAAASLSVIDMPENAEAALTIRAGSMTLCDIAEYFHLDVERDPASGDPISVPRRLFDEGYDRLRAEGVPVVDRDVAWANWSGWRVNYDAALIGLEDLTASPTVRITEGGTYG